MNVRGVKDVEIVRSEDEHGVWIVGVGGDEERRKVRIVYVSAREGVVLGEGEVVGRD